MPNGEYDRALPRVAMAVAEYRERSGEWPTAARGRGVLVILDVAEHGDAEDALPPGDPAAQRRASTLRTRLSVADGPFFVEVGGGHGWNSYTGAVTSDSVLFAEAYEWLYGERWNDPR